MSVIVIEHYGINHLRDICVNQCSDFLVHLLLAVSVRNWYFSILLIRCDCYWGKYVEIEQI